MKSLSKFFSTRKKSIWILRTIRHASRCRRKLNQSDWFAVGEWKKKLIRKGPLRWEKIELKHEFMDVFMWVYVWVEMADEHLRTHRHTMLNDFSELTTLLYQLVAIRLCFEYTNKNGLEMFFLLLSSSIYSCVYSSQTYLYFHHWECICMSVCVCVRVGATGWSVVRKREHNICKKAPFVMRCCIVRSDIVLIHAYSWIEWKMIPIKFYGKWLIHLANWFN